jgi:nucleotide-binding universal stress UspA family protein
MSPQKTPKKMNVLLAVDGSEHSYAAARLVRDLRLPGGSTITVLAVIGPRNASDHAGLEGVLQGAKGLLAGTDSLVRTELLTGYPAEQISQYAEEHTPDLIVLGAKGRRATLGILLGVVVQDIVEYASDPVLVVRAPYEGLRQVLLVIDRSPHSQRALEYLERLPLPEGTGVTAIHVLPPLPSPALIARSWPVGSEVMAPLPSFETEQVFAQQAEEEERHGRELLEQTLEHLQAAGIDASKVLLRGDAATEILEHVKAHQVDLIVAGSRGLSQMKRLLLGSLSRKLVHYASCSVLVVKGGSHGLD